jgi:hypothetical protein
LTIPENSRDFEIGYVHVLDDDNDNYTCSVFTFYPPDDRQPFEINNGILRTSSIVYHNSKKKSLFFSSFFSLI